MLSGGLDGWPCLVRVVAATGAAVFGYCVVGLLTSAPGSALRLRRLENRGSCLEGARGGAGAGADSSANVVRPSGTTGGPSRLGFLRRLVPERVLSVLSGLWGAEADVRAALAWMGTTVADVRLAGAVMGLGLLAVMVLAGLLGWFEPAVPALGLVVAAAGIGPQLWLRTVLVRHRAAVSRELPKVAELLTLATESGLGLMEAMRLASRLSKGRVGMSLEGASREIDAGREATAALKDVGSRVGGPEIRVFVSSVVQGLALGTPVTRILRNQAETLRARHRQSLEARIAGLSMRLTVVTILLFVPALFVLSIMPNLMAFLGGQW